MYVIIYFPSVYICTCMKKTVNKISIYLYMWWEDWKSTQQTDFIPEASSRPFIIISIRMSGLHNYYMSTHSVRSHYTDCHMQSRTTLYICRFPASRMHNIGATLIWEREPQATPTTTHCTP